MPEENKDAGSPSIRPADPQQADRLHRFAHDLRNRLSAIQQILQLLHGTPEGIEPSELLEFGEQQYFKAMREVEALQDDFSVDRTYRLSDPVPVDLVPTLAESIRSMAHRFERKAQTVQFDKDGSFIVNGDPRILADVVSALLSNASKFSPNGSVIRVTMDAQGGMLNLSISDNGVGLDEEDAGMIFQRYAWLKSRSTDGEAQGRSTLARSREQARAHGGDLNVHSNGPGEGCTFTLQLPLSSRS